MKLENTNKAIDLINDLKYLKDHLRNAARFGYTNLNFTFNNNDKIINISSQTLCKVMLDTLKDELANQIDIVENELKDL